MDYLNFGDEKKPMSPVMIAIIIAIVVVVIAVLIYAFWGKSGGDQSQQHRRVEHMQKPQKQVRFQEPQQPKAQFTTVNMTESNNVEHFGAVDLDTQQADIPTLRLQCSDKLIRPITLDDYFQNFEGKCGRQAPLVTNLCPQV